MMILTTLPPDDDSTDTSTDPSSMPALTDRSSMPALVDDIEVARGVFDEDDDSDEESTTVGDEESDEEAEDLPHWPAWSDSHIITNAYRLLDGE